jgi:NAD+ synthase (glutamine-hydrolysing)
VQKLRLERLRTGTFNDNAIAAGHPEKRFRRIAFEHVHATGDIGFARLLRRFPYVPNRPEQLDQDCYEAFNIQVQGLATRFKATSGKHLIIGVSGGLDSTHALIVAAKVCDYLGIPRSTILGYTMPGFATGESTKGNAWALMRALGIEGPRSTSARPPSRCSRTWTIPMRAASVVRTSTTSPSRMCRRGFGPIICSASPITAAASWSAPATSARWRSAGPPTASGDQMSHYGVNAGVPKTLIQYLVRWVISSNQFDAETEPGAPGDPRHQDLARAGARRR